MKNLKTLLILIGLAAIGASCELAELDNYSGPTAGLYGKFIDEETGELVEQDIIRGSVIQISEHGYDPVSSQYLVVKNDGTYANSRLFANTYTVQPVRGNFKIVDEQDVEINGQTELNFNVTPYIRIKESSITLSGGIVTASFKLEQTSVSNVAKIGLYGHKDPHVGQTMHLINEEVNLFALSDPNQVYTIEFDINSEPETRDGGLFFFRIGALIDVPEAKFNYAPAIGIDL